MGSAAVSTWKDQVYARISRKLGIQVREHEEIQVLKAKVETLRDLRKRILTVKHD